MVFAWANAHRGPTSLWQPGQSEPSYYIRSDSTVAWRGDRFLTDEELGDELLREAVSAEGNQLLASPKDVWFYAESPTSRIVLVPTRKALRAVVRDRLMVWRSIDIQELRSSNDPEIFIDGVKYEPGVFFNQTYNRWVIRWVQPPHGWRTAWLSPDGRERGVEKGYVLGWIGGDPLAMLGLSGLQWRDKKYLTGRQDDWNLGNRAGFQVGSDVFFSGPGDALYRADQSNGKLRISELGPLSITPAAAFSYSILPFRPNGSARGMIED